MKSLAVITVLRFLYFPLYALNINLISAYHPSGVLGVFISQVGLSFILSQILLLGFARGIYVQGFVYKARRPLHLLSAAGILAAGVLFAGLGLGGLEYPVLIYSVLLAGNQLLCALNYVQGRFVMATVLEYVVPASLLSCAILLSPTTLPIQLLSLGVIVALAIGGAIYLFGARPTPQDVSQSFYYENAGHAILDSFFARLPVVLAPFFFSGATLDSFSTVYSMAGMSGAVSQVLNRFTGVLRHVKTLTERHLQVLGVVMFGAIAVGSFVLWGPFQSLMAFKDPGLVLFALVWLPQFSKILYGGSVFAWIRTMPLRRFLVLDLLVIAGFLALSGLSYYAAVVLLCLRYTFYYLFLKPKQTQTAAAPQDPARQDTTAKDIQK